MLLGSGKDDATVSPGLFCAWHTVYHDRLLLKKHLMSFSVLGCVFCQEGRGKLFRGVGCKSICFLKGRTRDGERLSEGRGKETRKWAGWREFEGEEE